MTDLLSREQTQDHSLPDGWMAASLQELGEINPRFGKDELSEDLEVTFLPMKCVEEVSGKIDASNSRHVSEVRKGYTPFQEEDIIFAKITPCMENGKMAVARGLKNGVGFGSSEFHVVRPHESISRDFLFYFLVRSAFRKDAERKMTGSAGQRRVPTTYIKEATVPLPPLNEQRRIVEKIEELFTKLDAGVRSLEQARAQLKSYRRSVLKSAVEGELSREWREAQEGELEPASELLDRILQERREKWELEEFAKMKAKGKVPKNDKWKKKYKEPAAPELSGLPYLPDLPREWSWVSVGQLTWSVKDGPHYSPTYVEEGIPFVTGGNVRPNGVDFDRAKRITPELHAELQRRCRPEKDDILYTKGGTTGIARVNTYDIEFNVWVHVAVLKLVDTNSVKPFYMQHALNSPLCYAQSQKYTHGVGNQDLGLTRMVKIGFPLPPTQEQKWIKDEIERCLSVVDKLEATVEENLKQAAGLRQSILKQAFSGELVPQDPDDEPARVLLARIRSEREATKQKTGKKRRSKTAPSKGGHADQGGLF